jgi:hypothetical protein
MASRCMRPAQVRACYSCREVTHQGRGQHIDPSGGPPRQSATLVGSVQFNVMAGASQSPVPDAANAANGDPASRLRKLKKLLDAGLVSAEEFKNKLAAIIDSI